jgi:chorismate dehydratase
VQYLNTTPLVWGFTHGPLQGKYDLSFTVPSQCADDLRAGKADIAIIPAIEYQRIPDLTILPDLAVASKEKVRSLLLIAKKPIAEVQSIALDTSSRSTQALTRILCANHWRIAPQFTEAAPNLHKMLLNSDAALLIGDPALRVAVELEPSTMLDGDGPVSCLASSIGIKNAESLYVYDIVEEWRKLTNFPAVLAVWAARTEIVTTEIADEFVASLEFGKSQLDQICAEAAKELALPLDEIEHYLRSNIDFTLDDENRKGLLAYFSHAYRLQLIEKLNPINIAARTGVEARHMDFAWAKARPT